MPNKPCINFWNVFLYNDINDMRRPGIQLYMRFEKNQTFVSYFSENNEAVGPYINNHRTQNLYHCSIVLCVKYTSFDLVKVNDDNEKNTNKMSSNPVHGEVYSIKHHVNKLVSDLRQVGDFSMYSGFLH